jgi:PHP family Zn ribbon phosphoesterase
MGVLHRVEELADRDEGFRLVGAPGYTSIIPLPELIGETLGVGPGSKRVEKAYFSLLEKLGSEFVILREVPLSDIAAASTQAVADAVALMREGRVSIDPGYDGEYGKVSIFAEGERAGIDVRPSVRPGPAPRRPDRGGPHPLPLE